MAALFIHTNPWPNAFIAIKPDGVQRGLVGEILGRFERKGFKLWVQRSPPAAPGRAALRP